MIYWSLTLIYLILSFQIGFGQSTDNLDLKEELRHVRSKSSAGTQTLAAQKVIERLIPDSFHLFDVEVDFGLPDNTFKISKDDSSEKVSIVASSGVAICKGVYYYLKYFCNSHVSWEGKQITLPDPLPSADIKITSPSQFIYYQNVCTWSYTFANWNWSDWRRHIDWMALNGITLSLAPFQEDIWTEIYQELGLTKKEIDEHFAGPAFLAWQRMGNIRGWGGPLTAAFKERAVQLQRQMIKELRDLGISVALPAFAGHVPVAMQRLFPNASFSPVERWNRFNDNQCCPLFLDPTDDLFQIVGERFLQKMTDNYGSDHIYFSDPFNEIQPKMADATYLANAADGIYKTMKSIDPNAVWLLQGWMFVKNPFWSDDLLKAFLTAVPLGKMLVLDLQSEQHPQFLRTNSYYGQPFIWCMLHNFGGTLGMHGSMDILNVRIPQDSIMTNSTMVGVGITPEGINQNYVIYEFALEMGWLQTAVNLDNWIVTYAKARYGGESNGTRWAWQQLRDSVYSFKGLDKINGKYTICRRPSLKISPWTWYDTELVENAWGNLLSVADFHKHSPLFLHDLIDVTRQALQNHADEIYLVIIQAYDHSEITAVEQMAKQFVDLLDDLDKILHTSQHFLLGPWLEGFKSMATTEAERDMYELNARNQITLWGPKGQITDYATKQWSGIISDYFKPRWQLFFTEMITALKENRTLNGEKVRIKLFKEVEEPFQIERKFYPTRPEGDTVAISRVLYAKWADLGKLAHVPFKRRIRKGRKHKRHFYKPKKIVH